MSSRVIARWVQLWDVREGAEALAAVRMCVALVLLWDMATAAQLGLVEALWAPLDEGGIGPATRGRPISVVYQWLGASVAVTWALFATVSVAAVCLLFGLLTRTSALVLVLAYAQLAQLSPEADRGIDTLLRNVLLLIACSGAGATLSLDARLFHGRFTRDAQVLAWPRYLIVLQLVVLYFWAGMLKQAPPWTAIDGYSALHIVMSQPHYTGLALATEHQRALYPLLQLGTIATTLFERLAPLVPMLLWLRASAERGGRLRAIANRARLLEIWVGTGVFFHVGLAVVLQLGIFPWGCLALYPALASPRTLRAWAKALAGAGARRHDLDHLRRQTRS
jgi:hypothetical protein